MSEELIQRDLIDNPEKMGVWNFYNVGNTTLKAFKNAHIIPNRDYDEFESKKPDAIITNKPIVIAAIEYKKPSQLRTEKQILRAINQEIGVAQALQAKVYIVTDGQKSIWINPATGNRIVQEDGSEITLNFNKRDIECIKLINKIKVSISSTNDAIKAGVPVNPLPLAKKVWQDLWAVSGATPENCLYTFVEIFIFKYLSDLGVLKGMHSFYDLLSRYSINNENEVLKYYASTVRVAIKELFPKNTKDNTTIINGTIFVSKDDKAVSGYATVFHKILKRFNEFGTLENIDYDFKSKLFETFLKESISKKNWGQYFTPLKVVRAMVNMVDVSLGMEICDPACGVGKFLLELVLQDLHRYYKVIDGELVPQITLTGYDKGFDKEEQKTIILAKANMLIYMSEMIKEHPGMTKNFANLFNQTFFLQTNSILGTLARPEREKYDLIITNPPYVMNGSSNLKEEIAKDEETLKPYYAVSAMGIEGLFMEWIVRALKPGGKAFVVVPDGIMNRSNDKKLRDFILEQCVIDGVISLPLNTFFTTNKKTYILILTKKVAEDVGGVATWKKQTTPVFTYLCSEIGESRDVNRFDIEQNDLEVASDLYNMFKGSKWKFRTDDVRCKIVSIDDFYNGSHWCVERWWTREEKIALGIEEEIKSIHLSDFRILLSDAISALSELDEPLSELEKKNEYAMRNFPLVSLFDTVKGSSKYTKKFGNTHPGSYPVYSASSQKPLTYLDTFDYDGKYMSWSTNGFAGTILVLDGKFSINGDRGILIPKDGRTDVDLEYMKFILQPIFREMAKGRKGDNGEDEFTKLYPSMLNNVMIPLPIDASGQISLEAQQEIARRYNTIAQIKETIQKKRDEIADSIVSLNNGIYRVRKVSLTDDTLFEFVHGTLGSNKKKLSVLNTGHDDDIPVFTAGKPPIAHIKEIEQKPPVDCSSLSPVISFASNGDGSAGRNFIIHDRPFYICADRVGIRIISPDISMSYLKYALRNMKKEYGFNHAHKANQQNLSIVKFDVPILEDGSFDLECQQDIANKHMAIEQYKNEIIAKLDALIQQKVSL